MNTALLTHQFAPVTGAQPAETFVLILQDDRGLVYIDAVANANMQLHRMLGDGMQLCDRRSEVRFSLHAREIALSLRQQFRDTKAQDQIAPWVPGGLYTLGTDGFGRSETRDNLRRFFEIDAECTTIGTLAALAEKGLVPRETVAKAIADLGVNPAKVFPELALAL